ncbi:bifunctional UDP-N-acetylglucosamine diphosphorylase/glucosamine-1-phosphate N-acetyltransferase GlmU [Deinococcus pimensis]|uniref:bifunctional UDP-N-acetylglucosamine diphosphorylase/glucosamine-1-phosphate N-acetyltransferase GlmU n=1 Tax=Deinococcus pimensis TaxID=309888 RepID=UPI0005EBD98D
MRSALPKVLHPVMGRPMVGWAVKRARELGARDVVVVTGHGADRVEATLAGEGVRFARQDRQLGTGHAFLVGARVLRGDGDVLVLYGDTPLLTLGTLRDMLADHRAKGSAFTILTGELPDATGYGRILRDADGGVARIVEEKAASPEERRVREFNSGVYLMDHRAPALAERITADNAAGEYYLTDLLALYREAGARVDAFRLSDPDEVMGANDRVQLAQAERIMRLRLNEAFMRAGVTLLDPATTSIEDTVELGQDTLVEPGAILRGRTRVGRGALVGAYSVVVDSEIGEDAEVRPHSVLEQAVVGRGSHVGPFARLRSGAVLGEDVHVGNFVEVKNSTLERGVKAGHLAYLGDARVGEDSNIGAGTITANYDGVDKHRTDIGRGVFVGSNSTLIAPRRLGDAAYVAAGSTVHEDVPEGALAVARGRQRNVEGWSLRNWRRVTDRLRGRNVFLTSWVESRQDVAKE